MLVSWSGRGLLVPVIIVVVAICLIPFVSENSPFLWPAYTGLLSGIIIYFLGKSWNTHKRELPQEDSIIATKPKYQRVTYNVHKLYWIPVQYIGIIMMVIGIAFLVMHIMDK